METKEKKEILIIDDEEDILKVIGRRLKNAGYNVLTASCGSEALMILEKENPGLVLLDIGLPDMDGIEVCKRIKKHRYLSAVPIIFFTAKGTVNDKIKGLKEGVHDYITKPIDHRELLARIEAVLKINEHYQEISLTDELTGLYNYNFFQRQFAHTFDMAKRYGRIFSLIISDIDNFKELNDAYGHLFGNMALKKIGGELKSRLRKVDIITRYGGDEFAMILPETDYERAAEVVQRLKEAVGKTSLNYKSKTIELSLSFGLAAYQENIKTKEAFFNIADRNMYLDKERKGA